MKKLLLIALLSLCQMVFSQAKGTVKGLVTDKEMNNEPLPFANVFVKGTTIGGTTEMDGTFSFQVPAGSQTVVFSFVGYETVEQKVNVIAGKTVTVNQLMGSAGQMIEEVEIKATVNKATESAVLMEQKKATVIKESIGAVELSKKGVSNAAAATTKISGVTKSEGSGDIYIRGLGDRYLATTMNGLPIPSDDVSNKNINLGLFSTGIIQNVGISKTYATSGYADQGSGAVDIVSKSYSKKGITVGFSGGVNTNVMDLDNFKHTIIQDDVNYGFHTKKYALENAVTLQGWDPKTVEKPYNYSFSLGGATRFDLFGKKWSFVANGSYSSSNGYRQELFKDYTSNTLKKAFSFVSDDPKNKRELRDRYVNVYDGERFTSTMTATGYSKLGVKLNDKNDLSYNILYVNKGKDVVYEAGRGGYGFYEDIIDDDRSVGAFQRDQNFKQTTLIVNQLMGKHDLNEDNTLTWAGGYNFVLAEEPNRIRNLAFIEDITSSPQITIPNAGGFDQRKSSQKIEDTGYSGFIQNKSALGNAADEYEDKPYSLNYGINYRYKKRNFRNKFVGINTINSGFLNAPSVDQFSDLFLDSRFDSQILTRNDDVYQGELLIYAGFMNFDFKLNKKLSGNVGMRFEVDKIDLVYDVNQVGVGSVNKRYESLYPSVNLKYELTEKHFLRFASAVTQTLPEFKEISPFAYVSPTGRVTEGNTELEKSDVYNVDLKWEFFPSREELISAAVFYKQIENPINLTASKGSSGRFTYANTGDKADILGLELEGKVGLLKNEDEKSLLSATGNVTLMYLNQDLSPAYRYSTVKEAKLQGASDFIFNGSLSYNTQTENPFIATLTGNYSSDKIFALGYSENADSTTGNLFNNEIIEKGFFTLDAVLSKKIAKFLTVKVVGKNLLDPAIEQTQEVLDNQGTTTDQLVQSYKKGIQLSLGLSFSF